MPRIINDGNGEPWFAVETQEDKEATETIQTKIDEGITVLHEELMSRGAAYEKFGSSIRDVLKITEPTVEILRKENPELAWKFLDSLFDLHRM